MMQWHRVTMMIITLTACTTSPTHFILVTHKKSGSAALQGHKLRSPKVLCMKGSRARGETHWRHSKLSQRDQAQKVVNFTPSSVMALHRLSM